MRKIIILFLSVSILLGCSISMRDSQDRKKIAANEAIKIDLTVSKADLSIALGDEYKTSKMRAVEVFQNSTSSNANKSPVFRLFEIEDGSVYDLLGLKDADIVVAINERVVVAPHVLGQVVRLLPKEQSIKIEILRAGKSYLISTKFI